MSVGKAVSLFGFYALGYANSDLGAGGAYVASAGGGGFGGGFGGGGGGSPQFVMNSYDPDGGLRAGSF